MVSLPNVITLFRVLCSFALLLTQPFSAAFYLLYLTSGISDICDGYIARKTGSVTSLGSRLDSLADFILIALILIILVPVLDIPLWGIIWAGAIAFVRMLSLLLSTVRFHKPFYLHTYGNKLTGLVLFCLPLFLGFLPISAVLAAACSIASISALEELYVMFRMKTADTNIKGFWCLK